MKLLSSAAVAAFLLAASAGQSNAAAIVLDFEGVGNVQSVNNFYNGGTDSAGNSGTNYGIAFTSASLGLIDSDAGGTGNIANEPSGQTVLFFLNGSAAQMNVASGFTNGFSFSYAAFQPSLVKVYDGLNGTGNVLASLALPATSFANCNGDPNGQACAWDSIGVTFAGTAKSVDFGGSANQVAFDNITIGSEIVGGGAVPEPATWAMMIGGFGAAGAALRRRKLALA